MIIANWKPTPWSVPDCASLTDDYQRLKRVYLKAVEVLFSTGYQVSDAEYDRLKNDVEEARVQADLARHKLAKHSLAVH